MKLIKVGRQGQRVQEYAFNDNAVSIQDALNTAKIAILSGEEVVINDKVVITSPYTSHYLINNDFVLVRSKSPVLNKIKVGRVGQRLTEVTFPMGSVPTSILKLALIERRPSERLYLKKENNPEFDQDITNLENSFHPVNGDILVVEEYKPLNPKNLYLQNFTYSLQANGHIDLYIDNHELVKIISDYLKLYPL